MLKVVTEYNKRLPILTEDGKGFCVNARELHEQLVMNNGKGREFAKWIKERIEKYDFIEFTDYTAGWYKNGVEYKSINVNLDINNSKQMSGAGYSKEYFITIDMAIVLCRTTKHNPNSIELIGYLQNISGKNIEIKEQKRLEYQFGDMLDIITGFKWERQYPIDEGKYRLDFYLPYDLIVEYDEEQHEYQEEKDLERIKYCRDWLANNEGNNDGWKCPVIRVKKGQELEGLNRIVRHLAGFEMFDTQWDYKLEVCDIDNTDSKFQNR